MTETYDIIVVGGGVAGLSAAIAFGSAGRHVLCVDRAPAGAHADTRTTAFLAPAVALFERTGVWQRLSGDIAPLSVMRLIDAGGKVNEAREIADFEAAEAGAAHFGWNVSNAAMRAALMDRIAELDHVTVRHGTALEAFVSRRDHVTARLDDGTMVRAALLVGSDGRDSAVRRLAGIGARRWDYGQKALVFTVAHDEPHRGVSTEIHRTGGPFTLVPTPDGADGRARSSVVWMERAPEADTLARADEAAFAAAVNARALDVLGPLEVVSRRATWPIISLLADRLAGHRVALMGEAAHVVPPIGAQGLNMSIGDVEALLAATGGDDPGAARALERYQRRRLEIAARVTGIDALNRAAIASAPLLRDLRRAGLGTIARLRPVRQTAMRLGMGQGKMPKPAPAE